MAGGAASYAGVSMKVSSSMKIVAGVLSHDRFKLWRRTVKSLDQAVVPPGCEFELLLYDNGSSDGRMLDYVGRRGGMFNYGRNHTIGHGFRTLAGAALKLEPDVVVLSGDDYEYRPDWLEGLVDFWKAAPEDIGICTLAIEPEYHWTPILGVHEIGGQVVQERKTVPGANWSFRPKLWAEIEGMIPNDSHKYDHAVCKYLRDNGRWLGAIDLAVHIGEGQRSWR